jgi:hypothetical protein
MSENESTRNSKGRMLPYDPESVGKMVTECLKNPKGEIALILFDQKEGAFFSNLQIQGGENLVAVLMTHAVQMGNGDRVNNFIARMRIILDEAEYGIDFLSKNSSLNN